MTNDLAIYDDRDQLRGECELWYLIRLEYLCHWTGKERRGLLYCHVSNENQALRREDFSERVEKPLREGTTNIQRADFLFCQRPSTLVHLCDVTSFVS